MRTGRRAIQGLCVVTGGAGLIGSALLRHLGHQGEYRLGLVESLGTDGRLSGLAGLAIAEYWTREDFLRQLTRGLAMPPMTAVVHLGASTSTLEQDGGWLMRNNFAYTRSLAEWCLHHGVRFIYASSAATYGAGEHGYSDDLGLLPLLQPRNKYAYSKHAFDVWALAHGAFAGPNAITGLKYFNVYGPGEYHKGEMRSMVLKAYEQIQTDGVVRLFKSDRPAYRDGGQERDFVYVKDAAAITAWFLEHPEAVGVFNVGSGVARTWNDLARAVFAAMAREPQIEYVAMPKAIRYAYQYCTRADIRRLCAAGCCTPQFNLEAGVSDYVLNHLMAADERQHG